MSRFYGTTLRLVRDIGPISRIELMREMELSSPSLTKITNDLIDAGQLRETDQRDEGRFGRPRRYLDIAPNMKRLICASLMPDRIDLALAGPVNVLEEIHSVALSGQDAVPAILTACKELAAKVAPAQRLGLCLTLPAQVDLAGRKVLAVSRPSWELSGLVERLEAGLGLPVTLQNNVNAIAFAEATTSLRGQTQSLIYIHLERGLAAGMIQNMRGAAFSGRGALEFGHIRLDAPRVQMDHPCACGETGCLETLLTAAFLAEADAELTAPNWQVIAQAFANLLTLMSPETVMFGGLLAQWPNAQQQRFISMITARMMAHQRGNISFCASSLGAKSALMGAAAVGLDRFYFSGDGL